MRQGQLPDAGRVRLPGLGQGSACGGHRVLSRVPRIGGGIPLTLQLTQSGPGRDRDRLLPGRFTGESQHVLDRLLAAPGQPGQLLAGRADQLAADAVRQAKGHSQPVVAIGDPRFRRRFLRYPSSIRDQLACPGRRGQRRLVAGGAAVPGRPRSAFLHHLPGRGGGSRLCVPLRVLQAGQLGPTGQLLADRRQLGQLLADGGEPAGGLGLGGARRLDLLPDAAQVAADLLVDGLRGAQLAALPPRRHPGIVLVALAEPGHVAPRVLERTELVALLFQVVEGGRDVRDHRLVERGKRLREGTRQLALVGAPGQLRLAKLDEQVDQGRVPVGTKVQQVLVYCPPVRLRPLGDQAVLADSSRQPVAGQHGAGRADQLQVRTDALGCGEVPAVCDAAAGDRLQPAPDGEVGVLAILGAAAELQPGIPEPLVIPAAEQQVPFHLLVPVAVRLQPGRREIRVEQERQDKREHLGLAGAVVAAQHEPAVAEPELLIVVVEQIGEPGPERLPARAARHRQWVRDRRRMASAGLVCHSGLPVNVGSA